MTQLTELDYESIENAVMETARGRWFLAEHKKRHSGTDTPAILDAIARLEKVMTSINSGAPDQQKSGKVSATPFAPATIDIPSSLPAPEPETSQLSDENLQFFKNDEDLFTGETASFLSDTPTATGSPEASKVPNHEDSAEIETSKPAPERFKIFKNPPKNAQSDTVPPEVESNIPDPTLHPTTEEQDRIIVIRNTSGDDIDIPLADDFENTPETERSAPGAT